MVVAVLQVKSVPFLDAETLGVTEEAGKPALSTPFLGCAALTTPGAAHLFLPVPAVRPEYPDRRSVAGEALQAHGKTPDI
jgi:hypothetical protein